MSLANSGPVLAPGDPGPGVQWRLAANRSIGAADEAVQRTKEDTRRVQPARRARANLRWRGTGRTRRLTETGDDDAGGPFAGVTRCGCAFATIMGNACAAADGKADHPL